MTEPPAPRLLVSLISFGYKFGLPESADIVLDVRFLPNPFYDPVLGGRTGLDPDVRRFVEQAEIAKQFLEKSADWFGFLIPRYIEEGKPQLTIAVGCTGGRHRSVVVAECLKDFIDLTFASRGKVSANVLHRDIDR